MIAQLVSPINEFKNASHDQVMVNALYDKANKLFDLLKYRVASDQGISDMIEDLKEDVYELRISVINYMALNQDFAAEFKASINKEISERTLVRVEHKALGQTYREVLGLYLQIAEPLIFPSASASSFLHHHVDFFSINYSAYKSAFSQFPQPLAAKLALILDNSLAYELSLILIAQALDKQIKLKEKSAKELMAVAKNSIENFGFYSALLGAWKPQEEDESPIVRNIKIRLAVDELGSKRSPVSFEAIVNSIIAA